MYRCLIYSLNKPCDMYIFNTCKLNSHLNSIIKRFAGHSKWQNIRHIKGAKDAHRAAVFTKLSRQMKVAIQEGGSVDIKQNLKLENVVEQAKRASMPTATIQSVIKSCQNDKTNSKRHMVEIRGPGNCIILCEVFTNHLHALKQTISTLLRKHKSKYSDGGGIHLFQEKGIVVTEIPDSFKHGTEEDLLGSATDHAIEAGAEDVLQFDGDTLHFICGATNLKAVETGLEKLAYKVVSASVEYTPTKLQCLSDDDLELCRRLYEKLESLQEVIRLSDNIE